MKHLRDANNIQIKGTSHKQKLRNIGYFHGYKGYRYNHSPNNRIAYSKFDEVLAMNDFDMALKTLFYPQIMFIETALKNYVLEVVLNQIGTESFNDIFTNLLTGYKSFPAGSDKYRQSLKKRLALRDKIYSAITRDYPNKLVIQHFYHRDKNVPIWAIFEVISLGEFGNFLSCLDIGAKKAISKTLRLNQGFDTNGALTELIVYIIKDLRNAVAHNDIIFDTRFQHSQVRRSLANCLEHEMSIPNIDFATIVDYLILVCYLLKKMQVPKTEIKKMANSFEFITEALRRKIPISIFTQIIHTNNRTKLNLLRNFIKL